MNSRSFSAADRLRILRAGDPHRLWESLQDRRQCVLCERTFSGRQVLISADGRGKYKIHCPTENCSSTPHEWMIAGEPLLNEDSWNDWLRILSDLSDGETKKPRKKGVNSLAD